ncbi:MAG: hypothetical protein IJ379_08585 [Lachnospiraceae bacterium]|nr:hypothetical protein [Lachnospiraceae bacterium]
MSKRELVLKAFNNEAVERVPVGFWFHFAADAFFDSSKETVRRNIAGHQKYVDEFQPDFLKLMSDGFFGYPNEALKKLQSAADLDKIETEDVSAWIQGQMDLVKELTKRFKEQVLSFYNIFAPATYLSFLLEAGGNALTVEQLAKENPEGLAKVLSKIAKDVAKLSVRVITEGGVDGIYLSVRNIDGLKKAEYLKYIAPDELSILEAVNQVSDYNILHICGYEGHRNDLSTYVDYPAKVINWAVTVEQVSLQEGKKLFGGRAVIGGFDNTTNGILYKGSREEIEAETQRLLQEAGQRGVILGADCTIPSDTPLEHLNWVRDKAAIVK